MCAWKDEHDVMPWDKQPRGDPRIYINIVILWPEILLRYLLKRKK